MARISPVLRLCVTLAALAVGAILILPPVVSAQEEVTSAIRRYKQYEFSTGYYEEYEAKPRRQRPLVSVPGVSQGLFPYSPSGADVRNRARLADSHQGIKFYDRRRCEECHVKETMDIHTVRANLTCRQCHGGEPIASLEHYYSPLNPIRKHAFVCAKCHEGASASYAAYVIHEPAPGSSEARKTFPGLYYAYWFMILLIVGTLAFYIPHSFLVGLRELFMTKKKKGREE